MPSYELTLILRSMPTRELAKTMLPLVRHIQGSGGVVRDVQSLGNAPLHHSMKAHHTIYREGIHTMMKFDTHATKLGDLQTFCKQMQPVIRQHVVRLPTPLQQTKDVRCRFKPAKTR
eukprot:m.17404 g.17404  ORF g.17404 m.17404 type:complete len:117 (+) comp7436_c0_seq1:168-518(+)